MSLTLNELIQAVLCSSLHTSSNMYRKLATWKVLHAKQPTPDQTLTHDELEDDSIGIQDSDKRLSLQSKRPVQTVE